VAVGLAWCDRGEEMSWAMRAPAPEDEDPAANDIGATATANNSGSALVQMAMGGDRPAIDAICVRLRPIIYRVVLGAARSREDAEDITQEVFVRMLSAKHLLPDVDGSLEKYAATTARNLVRDRWRTEGRRRRLSEREWGVGPSPVEVEDQVLAVLNVDALLALLSKLPLRFRRVLALRYFEDRQVSEVAEEMGMSPGALRQLQHRALLALRAEVARSRGSVDDE
jgi:RNA polymerase sigma-70 factor (ECF subfamily)